MPDTYLQGIVVPPGFQSQIRDEISVIAINFFPNLTPFITRFDKQPVTSPNFHIVSRKYRPRTVVCNLNANNSVTTLTFTDASYLMTGDVLQTVLGERVEVLSMPNISTNVATVQRAVESTTANTLTSGDVLQIIGNSRTGGEINQMAIAVAPINIDQYCQNYQHVVQVSGSMQSTGAMQLAPGVATPLDQNKMEALQNLMEDFEIGCFFGLGGSASVEATGRAKQKGIRTILNALAPGNVISPFYSTSPTNAGAYGPQDLVRDTLQKARVGGGAPDVLIVTQGFITGFTTWGMPLVRLVDMRTVLGVDVTVFKAPFLNDVTIIEHPLLANYTNPVGSDMALALTSAEARVRLKRPWVWNPYASRGDAFEGDYTCEGAVEIENAPHHAWVEGITAFSAN